MNTSIKALLSTAAIVSIFAAPVGLMQHAEADSVDPAERITIPGPTVTLPGATVTIRVPLAPVTIRVPGPTLEVPGPTIRIPGPTVTVPAQPQETVTETVTAPVETETVTVPATPTRPVESDSVAPRPTETVTVSPPGQEPTDDATLDPAPQDDTTDDDASTSERVITKVVYVTVATIIVGLLGIFAMFMGYVLGRKDAERSNLGFMRALVTSARGDYH